eukprot:1087374-Prorocentrum_minimum.AAC.3
MAWYRNTIFREAPVRTVPGKSRPGPYGDTPQSRSPRPPSPYLHLQAPGSKIPTAHKRWERHLSGEHIDENSTTH